MSKSNTKSQSKSPAKSQAKASLSPKNRRATERKRIGSGRIYTKGGDQGQTSLASGERVPKDNPRLDTYGLADELNSIVGAVRAETLRAKKQKELQNLAQQLLVIQHDLFCLTSQLSCTRPEISAQLPTLTEKHTQRLELWMDEQSAQLPPLTNFILPGGSPSSALAHVARTVCRALERRMVNLARSESVAPLFLIYVNRLSDYFFVLARTLNRIHRVPEVVWSRKVGEPRSP